MLYSYTVLSFHHNLDVTCYNYLVRNAFTNKRLTQCRNTKLGGGGGGL